MSYAIKNSGPEASELIAFRIGNREFCVNAMSVREIRGWCPVTPLSQSPDDVMGVINLRGVVLPIVNLAARLQMKPVVPDIRHVIMAAQVRSKVVGLLVEAVSDILTVADDTIQPMPEVSSDLERQYARGILAIDKRMICLIELAGLFSEMESEAA